MEGLDVRGNSQAQHSVRLKYHGYALRRSFSAKNFSDGVIDHFDLPGIQPPLGHDLILSPQPFNRK